MTDEVLNNFDTNYKIQPPIRTKAHQKALIDGLLDGTIDCKKMEFDLAQFGSIGLEAVFGSLTKVLPLDVLIEKLTFGRTILGQNLTFAEGERACITLFEINEDWNFSLKDISSKSKNCAFLNVAMKGKVIGIINQNQIKIN